MSIRKDCARNAVFYNRNGCVWAKDGRLRGGCRAVAGRLRAMLARLPNGRQVQRSRIGKQCAAYYWGMQLQIPRRSGRRVQRSRKGKQCAAYYWGMQWQIPRRIGRRVQRSRKGKQRAAYYWGMQLQIARRLTTVGWRLRWVASGGAVLLGNATADC